MYKTLSNWSLKEIKKDTLRHDLITSFTAKTSFNETISLQCILRTLWDYNNLIIIGFSFWQNVLMTLTSGKNLSLRWKDLALNFCDYHLIRQISYLFAAAMLVNRTGHHIHYLWFVQYDASCFNLFSKLWGKWIDIYYISGLDKLLTGAIQTPYQVTYSIQCSLPVNL